MNPVTPGDVGCSSFTAIKIAPARELCGLPSGRGRQAELLASRRYRILPTMQFRGAEVSSCFAMQLLNAASNISSPTRDVGPDTVSCGALEIATPPY
jgi:hypothetical protein